MDTVTGRGGEAGVCRVRLGVGSARAWPLQEHEGPPQVGLRPESGDHSVRWQAGVNAHRAPLL